MRRYKMLIFTLLVFIATALTYFYEHKEYTHESYKLPSLKFHSDRFGDIRNISPIRNYNLPMLLILSTDESTKSSTLSVLNITKNTDTKFYSFNTHSVLQDKILMDNMGQRIVTVGKEGVEFSRIISGLGEDKDEIQLNRNFIEIKDFQSTNSIDYEYKLFYSKNNDNLIHSRDIENGFNMNSLFSNENIKEEVLYYKNPLSIIGYTLDGIIYYTKSTREGITLYSYATSNNGPYHKPITIKNFVHGKTTQYGSGLTGIYEDAGNFRIFIIDRFDPKLEIATIPKNTDALGQVPDVYTIAYNEEYYCIYSSFDENHIGSIYLKTHKDSSPKEMIKNQPIVGPIKLFQSGINIDERTYRFDRILFTTLENDKIHVKIYDINEDRIEDITEYFQ
jgi:hypothetical protein